MLVLDVLESRLDQLPISSTLFNKNQDRQGGANINKDNDCAGLPQCANQQISCVQIASTWQYLPHLYLAYIASNPLENNNYKLSLSHFKMLP